MRLTKQIHVLAALAACFALISAGVGLFCNDIGDSFIWVNQYGDAIKIYGHGLYKNDSLFRAPIFRGTDLVIFFIVCPWLIWAVRYDTRNNTLRSKSSLFSVLIVILYYSSSVAFGVQYNKLHLIYIAQFSTSFFASIVAFQSLNYNTWNNIVATRSYRQIYIFLLCTGCALFVAWLPDIITSLNAHRSLLLIENYTTEITYVLDMGVVAPLCFITIFLLIKRKGVGYVLLDAILTLCIIIGLILPVQTIFQWQEGIRLPLPVMLTKICVFCTLSIFALWHKYFLSKDLSSVS